MQMIQLQSPTPIFGEINLTSNPLMSNVYIDGVPSGQTPLILSDILIGKHKIRITHDGYRDYVSDVFVEEGKVSEIDAVLTTTVSVSINCNAPNADFYIDGRLEGNASGIKIIEVGKHKIEVKPKAYDNFTTYNDIIDFNGSTALLNIALEPRELIISFESDMPNTYLYVDNKMLTNKLGNDIFSKAFPSGEHELAFRCAGKREIKKKVIFSSSQNTFCASFKNREITLSREMKDVVNNPTDKQIVSSSRKGVVESSVNSLGSGQSSIHFSFSEENFGYATALPVNCDNKTAAFLSIIVNGFGSKGFSVETDNNDILKLKFWEVSSIYILKKVRVPYHYLGITV